MKIFYKEIELDSSLEHELIADSKFGYNVVITFNGKGYYHGMWLVTNIKEIHSRFSSLNRIAFESDIHKTGRTNDIDDIESIEIVDATFEYDKFWYNLSEDVIKKDSVFDDSNFMVDGYY